MKHFNIRVSAVGRTSGEVSMPSMKNARAVAEAFRLGIDSARRFTMREIKLMRVGSVLEADGAGNSFVILTRTS